MLCPCGSTQTYDLCCAPYHRKERYPSTPEALVRARYSAYAMHQIDFLKDSCRGAALDEFHAEEIKDLAEKAEWLGLEIIKAQSIDVHHATVEFNVALNLMGHQQNLHEISQFEQQDGKWRYVDGDTHSCSGHHHAHPVDTPHRAEARAQRNDPCPCGSGKKFKKCCLT